MSGIFFRLLLKAFIPVVMLFGMMSYMMYMQGKDPFAPLDTATSNIGGVFYSAADSIKEGVMTSTAEAPKSAERVYRWVDKDGVTHFGTFKPDANVAFETIRVNRNHNIMDPFQSPLPETTETTAQAPLAASQTKPGGAMPVSPANPMQIKEMLQGIEAANSARMQELQSIR